MSLLLYFKLEQEKVFEYCVRMKQHLHSTSAKISLVGLSIFNLQRKLWKNDLLVGLFQHVI